MSRHARRPHNDDELPDPELDREAEGSIAPLEVNAPWSHINEATDFPDDDITDEERALIEADERRRLQGLPHIEDPQTARRRHTSHIAHGTVKVRRVKVPKVRSEGDSDSEADDDRPQVEPSHLWLRAERMTQTELLLRLGLYLISSEYICGHVSIALRARELTRSDAPAFPLRHFLHEHHLKLDQPALADDWRGEYALRTRRFWLKLTSDASAADLEVEVGAGDRFLVFASAGMLESTRSPAEHRLLQNVIGRAVLHANTNPRDLIAVAVPRSGKFRRLGKAAVRAPRLAAIGLSVLLIDRAGQVAGLPFLKSFEEQEIG